MTSVNTDRLPIERPQMVVAGANRRLFVTIGLSVLLVVITILLAPFIFATVLVGKISSEMSTSASNGYRIRAERAGPGEVELRATALPTPALRAATAPAMTWPVDSLSAVTSTHTLAQKSEGLREDRWAFGTLGSGTPFAGLTLIQGDANRFHRNGFLQEALSAVRVNAGARLGGPSYVFDTRYGKFNGKDVTIDDGMRQRLCIGFVSAFDTPYAILSGVYCDAAGKAAGPATVACLIDRIKFDRAELQPPLAALADKAGSPGANCASRSFHEPGSRRPVYDSRGRYLGLR